jgi:hypothetical protein
MTSDLYHIVSVENLSRYPTRLVNLTKAAPQEARRIYLNQTQLLANAYNVTTLSFEQILTPSRHYA